MVNKSQFKVQNTKKVLHKVGKRWLVVSAIVLGLIAGGSAVITNNAIQANADTTTVQSASNDNPSTHGNHHVNLQATSEASTQTSRVGDFNTNDNTNTLMSLASEANTNHATSAYNNLFSLASNVQSYSNGMKFGSDIATNSDTFTWMGTLNQVTSDVNAINYNGSNSNLNTANSDLNKGTRFIENGRVGSYRLPDVINNNTTVLGHTFNNFTNKSYSLSTLSNVLTNNLNVSNLLQLSQVNGNNSTSDARYSKILQGLLHDDLESHTGSDNMVKANDVVQGINDIATNTQLSVPYNDFLTNAKKLPNVHGQDLVDTLNNLSNDATTISHGLYNDLKTSNPQGASLLAKTLNQNASVAENKATRIQKAINNQNKPTSQASSSSASSQSTSNSATSATSINSDSSQNTSSDVTPSSSSDNINIVPNSSAYVPSFIPSFNPTSDMTPTFSNNDNYSLNSNSSVMSNASITPSSNMSHVSNPISSSQIYINPRLSHPHENIAHHNAVNVNKIELRIIKTNNSAMKTRHIYTRLRRVNTLQKMLSKYQNTLKYQAQINHSYKITKALKQIKQLNTQLYRFERRVNHTHNRRVKYYYQRNILRNSNNLMSLVKNTFHNSVERVSHHKYHNNNLLTELKVARANVAKAQRNMRHAYSKRAKSYTRKHFIKAVYHFNRLAKQYNMSLLKAIKQEISINKANLRHVHNWCTKRNVRKNLRTLQKEYKTVSHNLRTVNHHSKRVHKHYVNSHARHNHHKRSYRRKK